MTAEKCNIHETGECQMKGAVERRKLESDLIRKIPDMITFFNRLKGAGWLALIVMTGSFTFTAIVLGITLEAKQTTHDYVDARTEFAITKTGETADIVTEIQYNLKSYLNKQEDFEYTEITTRVNVRGL